MSSCRATSHASSQSIKFAPCRSWAGLKNGELLQRAADAGFEIFVTADQNLEFQQNLARSRLGVVVLVAPSVALEDLRPLVPATLLAIARVRAGQVVRVAA